MSIKNCCACGKKFDYGISKGGQELSGGTQYKFVCQECCDKIGIKKGWAGAFKASTMTAPKFLKKLYEVEPTETIKHQLEIVTNAAIADKQAFKDELNAMVEKTAKHGEFKEHEGKLSAMAENKAKHRGCKEQKETKYTCTQCGHIYFIGATDELRNICNILNYSVYSMNHVKESNKCPHCGSRQTKHEIVSFWVDKNGNVVD